MFLKVLTITFFFSVSITSLGLKPISGNHSLPNSNEYIDMMYANLQTNHFELPQIKCFSKAVKGFYKLKEKGIIKKDILTLIYFSLSANSKRLWVIDLATKTILFQSLVAHGRNTGEEYANSFSNSPQSFKSSIGFYSTGEVYIGKHGVSLRLDGLEKGVNDNARSRGVVMHAADYVSTTFIKNNKRLGRSQGCPAVLINLSRAMIGTIKDESCLFIYHPKLVSPLIS